MRRLRSAAPHRAAHLTPITHLPRTTTRRSFASPSSPPLSRSRPSAPTSTPTLNPGSTRHLLLRRALILLNSALLAHLFSAHVLTLRPTAGPSMLPTFALAGDFALISHLHRRARWLQPGDLVSFENPVRGDGHRGIKRVVGLPGDFVLRDSPPVDDGVLPPADVADAGVAAPSRVGKGREVAMVQVPEGHVWVVGDNMLWSRDSRHFGPLPMALVRGKVLAKYEFARFWTWGTGWTWLAGSPWREGERVGEQEGFCDAGRKGAKWAGEEG